MKRLTDIILSFLSLIVLLPLFLLIIIILRITGEGEIFYLQNRVGLKGKSFKIVKFATMLKESPNIGAGEITLKNDPRVLPFGKFLRKSKINELPQLYNILIGQMSIVGPRPMTVDTYTNYPNHVREKLYELRPGLTGIGSIVFRDEERYLNNLDNVQVFYREQIIPHKCDLEVWFAKNNTYWVYIKIIYATVCVVLFPNKNTVYRLFDGMPKLPDSLILKNDLDEISK